VGKVGKQPTGKILRAYDEGPKTVAGRNGLVEARRGGGYGSSGSTAATGLSNDDCLLEIDREKVFTAWSNGPRDAGRT
jgi:hypothetical protein